MAKPEKLHIINPLKGLQKLNEDSIQLMEKESEKSQDFAISKKTHSWIRRNNSFFVTQRPNAELIPPGLYDVKSSYDSGIFLDKRTVMLDDLYIMPDDVINDIMADFLKFWNRRQKYIDYGITHKRGILMYGIPGSGKTSLTNILTHKMIEEHNGIVLNVDNLDSFVPMVQNLRCLEPTTPLMGVIEDLDSFLQYNSTKEFLNLLDGNLQVDNIIYVATTNYLEQIEDRIKNRPSRFDLIMKVDLPSAEVRQYYLEKKLTEEDKSVVDVQKWVADTNNMSISHLKELIVAVLIMGQEYNDVITRLRSMNAGSLQK